MTPPRSTTSFAGLLQRWAYPAGTSRRDLRLDFLRGFAVFAMVVDHFGGRSYLTPLTGSNEFLVSAAEGFVFLSGFVMGMVYGRRLERDGWVPTTEAILRRAAVLYLVTVGLTLLFVGLFMFTDLRLWLDRAYGLGLTDPLELVVGTLTLHYTYHGTDILWMYTVMIAATPILFHLLLTGRSRYVLAGSILLWWVYQLFPAQAAIPWVVDNAVYFPVAAWQLYFVTALVMGYHREALARYLGRLPHWPTFLLSALAFLGLILLDWGHKTGRLADWPLVAGLAGETYDQVFNKPAVSWGRVLAFALAAVFFFSLVSQLWRPLSQAFGWLLIPLGQAALLAYGLHLIVIVAVYNLDLWGFSDRSRGWNTLLQAISVGVVWGLVQGWDHLGTLPGRLARLLDGSGPARQRYALAAASLLLAGLAAGTALLIGPVRAARNTTMAAGARSAGTLVYAPETLPAESPARLLLVLNDASMTGPETAMPLIEAAGQAGWVVIAPTLEYGEWTSQEEVRAAATELLPALQTLVEQADEHVEHAVRPRALIYGQGRGGQLAQLFALAHPDQVRGVATVDTLPCTLPLVAARQPGPDAALDFPAGLADLEDYVGEPANLAAISTVSFWLDPRIGSPEMQDCAWLERPVDPGQQVQRFAVSLEEIGAEVQVAGPAEANVQPWQAALRFLDGLTVQ